MRFSVQSSRPSRTFCSAATRTPASPTFRSRSWEARRRRQRRGERCARRRPRHSFRAQPPPQRSPPAQARHWRVDHRSQYWVLHARRLRPRLCQPHHRQRLQLRPSRVDHSMRPHPGCRLHLHAATGGYARNPPPHLRLTVTVAAPAPSTIPGATEVPTPSIR